MAEDRPSAPSRQIEQIDERNGNYTLDLLKRRPPLGSGTM